MKRRSLATGIACVLVGACATFAVVGQGFGQKTTIEGKAAATVGRYQGAVNQHGNLYLFDTATGEVWITAIEPSKPDGEWAPAVHPVTR
jgi:hypothetical protein